jgi:LmbE family N-acetylglucosaminyl deacetylase
VVVIIATDGERSDREGRAGPEVAEARRAETRAALSILGVPTEDVVFLGEPDGELASATDLADRIGAELERVVPDLVLVCAASDGHSDHVAAHRATVAAARTSTATVLEYPVWAWVEWPWAVVPQATGLRRAFAPFAAIVASRPSKVRLGCYRATKQAALACYDSQLGASGASAGEGLSPEIVALFDRSSEVFLRCGLDGASV